jgi:phage regulator Rha-like protein
MLDKDLAKLYGVSVKRLNEQVKRNIKRFPQDFMFLITRQEVTVSRSQFATLSSELSVVQGVMDFESEHIASKHGQNIKYLPFAFTEQGVAMLSSVLNSERSIQVNIVIMRAFVKLKELLLTHKDLADKIAELERKYDTHDDQIQLIFEAIKKLLEPVPPKPEPPAPKKPPIGFHAD